MSGSVDARGPGGGDGMPMQRIAIIGCSGAGKTTLARQLSAILRIEATHMDLLFWRPGWTAPPADAWREQVVALAAGERWILDGNYGGTMDVRLAAADTIILLDMPRLVCLARVIWRYLRHLGRPRLDRADGCDEKLDWQFLHYIWTYPAQRRARVLRKLAQYAPGRQIIILHSQRDVQAFLRGIEREQLPASAGSDAPSPRRRTSRPQAHSPRLESPGLSQHSCAHPNAMPRLTCIRHSGIVKFVKR